MDGTNLYAYVANDPVNFIDPVGLSRWSVGARTALSVLQRGLAGALSVLDQPVEQLTSKVFRLYDANRNVFLQLEGHTYQVLRPYRHLTSTVQGLGLLLGGLNIVVDPYRSALEGKLSVAQAQQMIRVRGLETMANIGAAAAGVAIGTPGGPAGAAIGAVTFGTGSAWLTRKIGNWVLESVLDVPVQ